jgi:hypothetical protein
MSQPEGFENEKAAARIIEVPIAARTCREAVPVLVVIRTEGDASGATAPGDATLAA